MHEFSDCQINFQDEKDVDIKEEDQPMNRVITYIVVGLPYSIFQIQYIFMPDLLHMRG